MLALVDAGYRTIAFDRRGHGRSSDPCRGYDFDTLSGDVDTVLRTLDLREVSIVSFSLGTGELARYIGRFGTDRLRSVVFIESLTPTFANGPDNPKGVDEAGVDRIIASHLLAGEVVADLAYLPLPGKQTLR